MKTFTVSKGLESIDLDTLGKILRQFQSCNLPLLNDAYNYYMGKQKIIYKEASDDSKPCNRIVCNFVKNICDTYAGYAVGVPPTYASDEDIEEIQNVLNYNDVNMEDTLWFKQALQFGIGAEICYIDEDGATRFAILDPRTTIPVYSDTLDSTLQFAIRFWEEPLSEKSTPDYYVEVYSNHTKKLYKSGAGFASFTFLSETPHYFNQVPITFFDLNTENQPIAAPIFDLQDAYNSLLSGSIDDWDSFCDAYMVIKGCGATDDELSDMKQHRILLLDNDSDAHFLTKSVSDTQIQNLLNLCETKIREISACPNFASESFGTSSGIAIKYRCLALENSVSSILNFFKTALQRRIELIVSIINLKGGESMWRDIEITFYRNFPDDLSSTTQYINQLRGLVSNETLLSQIPFIKDPKAEMQKLIEEQNSQLAMYDFTSQNTQEEIV